MIEQKINTLLGKYICRHCPQHHELDKDYCKGSDPECMTLNAIVKEFLALIEQEQKPLIPYEKVAEKLNRRVMLGATQIGSLAGGGEVLQSANKNVITICHKGFYYHINLTDLVPIILDWEEKNGLTTISG